jgi:mRNA-degrading endonuclease RelE of RelBE toxin-antitoxin system
MMEFRIAATFTDSLARLTADEQKAVKTTAFDLQLNPASPGMSFHKLDRVKDKNFWSVRVSSDIRLIVHKSAASILLCFVDHHDKAYDLQERIETVGDDADLQEVYDTERHLLYVACMRARDHLLVTSGEVPSKFLDDLGG